MKVKVKVNRPIMCTTTEGQRQNSTSDLERTVWVINVASDNELKLEFLCLRAACIKDT